MTIKSINKTPLKDVTDDQLNFHMQELRAELISRKNKAELENNKESVKFVPEYKELKKKELKPLKLEFNLVIPVNFKVNFWSSIEGRDYGDIEIKGKLQGEFTRNQRSWLQNAVNNSVENACPDFLDLAPSSALGEINELEKAFKKFRTKLRRAGTDVYLVEEASRLVDNQRKK